MQGLDTFPSGNEQSGFTYRGYEIYFKPYQTYLLFYTIDEYQKTVVILRVLQDSQNWKYIIGR